MDNAVIKLGKSLVGESEPVYIIAEMACAHEGDFNFARRIVDAAIEAKASAIKFQVFTADGLVVPSHELHSIYEKFQFTSRQWLSLANQARQGGLDVLIDVFEQRSLEVAKDVCADGLKVHSTNVTNPFFLEKVAGCRLPVLIGTGGTYKGEIQEAVDVMRAHNVQIVLIHGFQGYPTAAEDTNLRRVHNLMRDFGVPVGFAGHANGAGKGLLWQNIMALGLGCSLLETHLTLDRSPSRTDYHASLLPAEFKEMVSVLREMEKALGSSSYDLGPAELSYRATFKTFIVSTCELGAGHQLCFEDFAYKRAEYGLVPVEAKKLLGKRLARAVGKDEPLVEDILVKGDDTK